MMKCMTKVLTSMCVVGTLAIGAALPFALAYGLDKQAEIDEKRTPDICRAYPRSCDNVALVRLSARSPAGARHE